MNLKLTIKAKEEKDKLTAGDISSIKFSKMAVGSGLYSSEELLNDITELRSVKIRTDIADVYQEMVKVKTDVVDVPQEMVKEESQLFITSTFFNEDIDETFEVREVGIYAISNEDSNEYLYAYYIVSSTDIAISIIQDRSLPQYIPISVNTKLSNIDEVNITVLNDILVVNQDEFKRYKEDIQKYIDDEDISIRTYLDEEDTKIKSSIVEQDTSIRTYIDEEDLLVKTYADEQDVLVKAYVDAEDTKIETLVNTKANSNHTHSLSSSSLTGVLPTSKGGTGNTTGGANAYVSRTVSNPTYLVGTNSSSNNPTLHRITEVSYVKHINMQSYTRYGNGTPYQVPRNGWIKANVDSNRASCIRVGYSHGFLMSDDAIITFCWTPAGVLYFPIRAWQYFMTEYCNAGVKVYWEV